MAVTITEIQYKNFGKCVQMENDAVTVRITADVGPRVIFYGAKGMENMLLEDIERKALNCDPGFEDYYGQGKKWYIYGGHRLWFSPEAFPRTYYPDNNPVDVKVEGNTVIMTPPPQEENGVAYTLSYTLDESTSKLTIGHTITRIADEPIELAPWGLTVMDQGGIEILPQSQKETGLLSNRRIVMWPYNDMLDDRQFIGNKYITLKQDPNSPPAIKLGTNNEDGWAAYFNKGQLFKKAFPFVEGAKYPDFEVNYETYTNNLILEMESLGTLSTLQKGESASYDEVWTVTPCSDTFDRKDEASIDAFVKANLG